MCQETGSDGFNKNHLSAEGGNDTAGFLLMRRAWTPTATVTTARRARDQTFAKVHFKPDSESRLALICNLEQNGGTLGQTWEAYKHDPRSSALWQPMTRAGIDHQQLGMNYERYVVTPRCS